MPEALFSRAGRLRLFGREVLCPTDADCLIISCVNGTKDRRDKVESLLCLAVQVLAMAPPVWQDVLDLARDAGCARRVFIGVAHACRVFGLPAPPPIAMALDRDRAACALLRSLKADSLNGS